MSGWRQASQSLLMSASIMEARRKLEVEPLLFVKLPSRSQRNHCHINPKQTGPTAKHIGNGYYFHSLWYEPAGDRTRNLPARCYLHFSLIVARCLHERQHLEGRNPLTADTAAAFQPITLKCCTTFNPVHFEHDVYDVKLLNFWTIDIIFVQYQRNAK